MTPWPVFWNQFNLIEQFFIIAVTLVSGLALMQLTGRLLKRWIRK